LTDAIAFVASMDATYTPLAYDSETFEFTLGFSGVRVDLFFSA
jgi:hypothetical protein